jgi:hypothetical protein
MFCYLKIFRDFIFRKTGKYSLFLVISFSLGACNQQIRKENSAVRRTVEIREQNGKYQLYRNGQPYFIKGAAGPEYPELLKEAGGNSIRTWDTQNAQAVLDSAHKNGLTVTLGLRVGYAGVMDYSDESVVQAQLERLKEDVIRYKDHPALLMWGIGNELNARIASGAVLEHIRLWQAVNDIGKMIHEVDPNHPTTTMLPDIPKLTTRYISTFCKEIDVLAFNVFDNIKAVPERVSEAGWEGPYLVSEYGVEAYWNTPRTEWYAQVEPTSGDKVKLIQQQYHDLKTSDTGKWLGAYAFYWGFKREYTATWFSLFSENGERTEMIDALQYVWSGGWPVHRAPSVREIFLNNQKSEKNIYLEAGRNINVSVNVQYQAPEDLILNWEVQKDFVELYFDATYGQSKATVISQGTLPLSQCVKMPAPAKAKEPGTHYQLVVPAPKFEGPYRLMVSVVDKKNRTATGNGVFYVYN